MFPDVRLTDFHVHLEPATGKLPFEPVVSALRVDITSIAFDKVVRTGVQMMREKVPVEIEILHTQLLDGGAEISARAKRGLLKAELKVQLAISSHDPSTIRVRVAHIDGPSWLPVGMVLEQGFDMASRKRGITRVQGDERAIDIDPAVILTAMGVPGRLAPHGVWSVFPTTEELGVAYASESI